MLDLVVGKWQIAGGVAKAPLSVIGSCGQAEYSFGKVRGTVAELTAVVNSTVRRGVQTMAVYTSRSVGFYQAFSTGKTTFSNLLNGSLYPLSTGPIKNKNKVINLTVINWSK